MSLSPVPNRASLAVRLTAWYTLASIGLLGAATALLYVALSVNLGRNSDQFLADKVNVLRTMLRERPEDWNGLREEVELESAARRYEHFYIRLTDERGKAVLTTPGFDEQIGTAELPRRESSAVFRSARGSYFRGTAARAPVGGLSSKIWTVFVAVELTQERQLLADYRRWVWALLGLAVLGCPLVGFQIARRGIRPLREVAEIARRIGSSTMSERIRTEGYPVEIAEMAGMFNGMLDRLEASFEQLSRFSADIAHELRTPVNNIRGEAEVALARARGVEEYRDVLSSCLEETVRLSDLIASLLFLARTENPGTHISRERVNLRALLTGVQEYYEASATDAGVAIAVRCAETVEAELDRALMQRALGNLVSNALANTAVGGAVVLCGRIERGSVSIDVEDTGCGIAAEMLPHIFQRFYRADPARSQHSGGTGLGLAIVQGIMALHGGSARVSSAVGRGTTVTLSVPNMTRT